MKKRTERREKRERKKTERERRKRERRSKKKNVGHRIDRWPRPKKNVFSPHLSLFFLASRLREHKQDDPDAGEEHGEQGREHRRVRGSRRRRHFFAVIEQKK